MLTQIITAARGDPRPSQGDPFVQRCKDFKDLGGKFFDGLGGVPKVMDWITQTEHIFDLMELDSSARMHLASHHLLGSASLWWIGIRASFAGGVCSWDEFLAAFRAKFIPRTLMRELFPFL